MLFATIPLLLIAIYQDWKTCSFWAWIVGAVFVIGFANSWLQQGIQAALKNWLWSTLFISAFLAPVLIYLKLKLLRWSRVFDQGFGLGDVLLLLAVTPIFTWKELPVLLTAASLIALIFHWIILRKDRNRIPFVSYLGSVLIALITIKIIPFII